MCWRMRSQQKTTRILECGIYRTDAGLEVRAGYAPDDLLYSMRVSDEAQGSTLAESLRQTVFAKGGFTEINRDGEGRDGRRT